MNKKLTLCALVAATAIGCATTDSRDTVTVPATVTENWNMPFDTPTVTMTTEDNTNGNPVSQTVLKYPIKAAAQKGRCRQWSVEGTPGVRRDYVLCDTDGDGNPDIINVLYNTWHWNSTRLVRSTERLRLPADLYDPKAAKDSGTCVARTYGFDQLGRPVLVKRSIDKDCARYFVAPQ